MNDETARLWVRLQTYRRNLDHLLERVAKAGGMAHVSVQLFNDVTDTRAEIAVLKRRLRALGAVVPDQPDDGDEPGTPQNAQTSSDNGQTVATEQGILRLGAHSRLQALDTPSDDTVRIGETHLVAYCGPPDPDEPAVRLELEQAYRSELALRYAEWHRRYVPLPLQAQILQVSRTTEREQLFFEAMRAGAEDTRPFTDLREGLHQCGDMLLLGPPGAGKTTALWRLALDLAEDGLFRQPDAPLPVFVRLGALREGQTPLERLQEDLTSASIDDAQRRTRPLPAHQALAALVPRLLAEGRLVLLWDGLNETPQRLFVQTARQLAELRRQHSAPLGKACVQHLITCRADDHERLLAACGGNDPLPLARATLQGLDQQAIRQIVLARLGPERGLALLQALEAPDRRTLAGLARTPLLLTMLCTVYQAHGTLPGTRGRLLEQFVQKRMEWERQRAPDATADAQMRKALARLAYAMTEGHGRGTSADWGWAREHLARVAPLLRPEQVLARARACDLLELVAQGTQVRFSHQLIQEYFAALALRGELQAADWRQKHWLLGWFNQQELERYAAPGKRTGWEETLLLLAGLDGNTSMAHQLVRTFLAQPLEAVRLLLASGDQPDSALLDEMRDTALAQIRDPKQRLAVRLVAGEVLGLVGDPRLLDPRTGDAPVGGYWCPIKPGLFWFGDDRNQGLQQIEQPYPFRIGRFPVTNAEYRRFVEVDGYHPDQPWWSPEGRKWLLPGGHPYTWEKNDRAITRPCFWDSQEYNQPSQPVVGVSWYEAAAYCAWLTAQGHQRGWLPSNMLIRLPTWREWQRAARHIDRRRYPWGDAAPDPALANYDQTGLKRSSPVGSFPAGQAVCGALDMAGNVWEWSATPWEQPRQVEPLDDVEQHRAVLIAGGSFLVGNEHLCCGARDRDFPFNGFVSRGFRVVWSPRSLA